MKGMRCFAIFVLLVGLVCWVSSSALASPITVDGNYSDWGFNTWSGFNTETENESAGKPVTGVTNGVYWWEEDGVGESGYVGPGYGGQTFDVEGLYTKISDGYLYFMVISGMRGSVGSRTFEPGDIVINLLSNDVLEKQYVVETTGYRFDLDSSGYVSTTAKTGEAGYLYDVTGGDAVLGKGLSNWQNSSDNQDPTQITEILGSGIPISLVFAQPGSEHSVIEGAISLSLLNLDGINGINIHYATVCGNDGGTTPNAPVPEPGTILLVGTGLLGLALGSRKRKTK
ncbi:MAG TPA: PEP-CTERM sorting domain-containing protein [Deltaproteobacteria bacterium]|nr:PEP-CTERM sorting domain-containing protein [Deltaproteobacteria bacterium]